LAPGVLATILERLPSPGDRPEILVGLQPGDDAAVWRLDAERALVATVDVITPIVDDPATFGRIAATNSISDVYAMGGRPLMALSVACFNERLPDTAMAAILEGAAETALEAGAPILGGHTIKDSEVKFGLAVVGEVHPDRILRASTARPGQAVILNKAIGTAALATAFKAGSFDEADERYQALVSSLLLSNRRASEIAVEYGASAATDVTGFGLSGHALELAEASGVGVELEFGALALLPGAREALEAGHSCGGAQANRLHAIDRVLLQIGDEDAKAGLLHDPQTSGPLLFCIDEPRSTEVVEALRGGGYSQAARVGRTTDDHCGRVRVV
jgi:selenide,water dikinase